MKILRLVLLMMVFLLWAGTASAKDAKVTKSKLLPRTGQVLCYDNTGSEIDCANTGQDGEFQTGVELPVPRFQDNGNGTITDNLTNLVWLQNANCMGTIDTVSDNDFTPDDGRVFWQTAMDFANNLSSGQCDLADGSVAGDWRLPNVRELHSLVDYGNKYLSLPDPTGVPFTNFQAALYWTSTTRANCGEDPNAPPCGAWIVVFKTGDVLGNYKGYDGYAIAVRGGK